ncbi:MAG: hypothetical protein U0M42_00130 [Acutalibacteraceae bacterium]|nr:hypothetical protein [Acutalibacteraceae bacterium]
MLDIFKKQYVLSSCEIDLPNMNKYSLGKAILYTHNLLKTQRFVTDNGKQIIVVGNAYCMDCAPKSIESDITEWDGKSLVELTRNWTGRWILFTDSDIVTDACGLMSAFYKNEDNRWIVSSSLAVMGQLMNVNLREECSSGGLNWYLLPNTKIGGISKLCSTQRIVFSEDELEVKSFIWQEDFTALSTEEKSRELGKMLVNACKNISREEKDVLLALTGGKDSRLVFSALLHSGIDFSTYTFDYLKIRSSDKSVPKKMARANNIQHSFIKRGKYQPDKNENYKIFTFGNTNGLDKVFYAYDQFDKIPKEAVIIRSGFFEAGQRYGRTVAGNTLESFENGIKSYYFEAFKDEKQREAFELWLGWIKDNPIPFIDVRDRFYIEQRVGGWAAAIEQSLDLNDFTSIQIANCPRLLSLLLSASEDERMNAEISMKCIQQLKPELLKYPVNKTTFVDMVFFFFDVMRNPIKRLRNFTNRHRRK